MNVLAAQPCRLPRSKRRAPWLALVALGVTLAGAAAGFATPKRPPRSTVRLVQLKLPAHTTPQTSALRAWAQEVRLRTSVHIAHEPLMLRADSARVLRYPLLILAGRSGLGGVSRAVVARLRTHLTSGGLLLIDDVGRSGPSAAFDRDVRKLIKRAVGRPLRPISAKDVVYRTFYRLPRPFGRRASSSVLEGVRIGRRWAVLYSRNDLLGAFERAASGGSAKAVLPGGERQRELAWRLGVNLIVYAVSLDYKDDHTHIQHLLRRRRGR